MFKTAINSILCGGISRKEAAIGFVSRTDYEGNNKQKNSDLPKTIDGVLIPMRQTTESYGQQSGYLKCS